MKRQTFHSNGWRVQLTEIGRPNESETGPTVDADERHPEALGVEGPAEALVLPQPDAQLLRSADDLLVELRRQQRVSRRDAAGETRRAQKSVCLSTEMKRTATKILNSYEHSK